MPVQSFLCVLEMLKQLLFMKKKLYVMQPMYTTESDYLMTVVLTEKFKNHLLIETNCSLNIIGSHKLIGSDTIRRCGFVGVGVAFLEEVCHCGQALRCLLLKLLSV